ncbi:hypothetical protein AB0F68_34065 [Micromonospora sp. NPDC023966]|uniref:hypothetical protein n=1 Tax=Micromonospora sp. NPDC023966 TaxID=3154699 RepID=UPI00340DF4C5
MYIKERVMTHREKRAWIMLVVAVVAYAIYVTIVVGRAGGRPLADVPYAAALLWTVGASIVANIVAEIAIGMVSPKAARVADARDRQIGQLGDHVGQSFLVAGAVAAMLMAMAGWDRFWIANVIYLAFVLSAVLGSVAKIGMYHGRLPQW